MWHRADRDLRQDSESLMLFLLGRSKCFWCYVLTVVKGEKAFVRIMTTLIYFFEANTSGRTAVIKVSDWRLSKLGLHSRLLEDMDLIHGGL